MRLTRKVSSALLTLGLLAGSLLVFANRQNIYDWYRLRGYNPPQSIVALANDTTMLPGARRLFYVYHPDLEGKTEFNAHCQQDEQTIVLGCYILNQGIYLYTVTDKRLDGVEEVTAAHELLHAEYDRLSSKDRKHVDELINQAYSQLRDARIKQTIDNYRKNGADVTNELHSILGTEVRSLPPELENYYKRYFSDRGKVVSYSEQYEGVFVGQENKAKQLSKQIDALESYLSKQKDIIENDIANVQSEAERLNSLKAQNRVEEYNAGVAGYNSDVNALNSEIAAYNAKVQQYRDLIDEYNRIAQTVRDLNRAIDSRIAKHTGL